MNGTDAYKVNGLQVFERSVKDPATGALVSAKTLTFKVGGHGPFTRDFIPPETGTADTMKTAITQQVEEIRALDAHQP